MAGSTFGSLHAGMLLREKTQGETPAATKLGSSRGPLQDIEVPTQDNKAPLRDNQPEHLLHPEIRASGVRSGPEFQAPDDDIQPPSQDNRPAPFDRGFGRRVPGRASTSQPEVAVEAAVPAMPESVPAAAGVWREPAQPVQAAVDAEAAKPAPDAGPEPDKVAAWQRLMFDKVDLEQDSPVDSGSEPASPAAQEPLLIEKAARRLEDIGGPVSRATTREAAPSTPQAPLLNGAAAKPFDTIEGSVSGIAARATPPLPHGQPAEAPAPAAANDEPAPRKRPAVARIRKKLTVRLEMPSFRRLLAACKSLDRTRQDIIADAVDRYLDDLAATAPDGADKTGSDGE